MEMEAPAPQPIAEAAAKTITSTVEQQRTEQFLDGLSGRDRALAFSQVRCLPLEESKTKGTYEGDEVLKEASEKALVAKEKRVDELDTQEAKATIDALEKTPDEGAKRVFKELSPYARVTVGDGEEKKTYSLEEWNQFPPEQRTQLENQAQWSFEVPQEPQGPTVETSPRTDADRIIDKHLTNLKYDWQAGKLEGDANEQKRKLLVVLRLASQAKGDLGPLFKFAALQGIKEIGGQDVTLGSELNRLTGEVNGANGTKEKLMTYLNEKGLSAEQLEKAQSALATEGLAGLLRVAESLPELNDLDQRIFGREVSEGELQKMLNTEDPNKQLELTKKVSLWTLVLLLFSGFKVAEKITEEASR